MTKEWIKKAEAAEILGMSERSVLVMAQMGQIQSKLERDEETKQMTKLLHAGDVERVRYERANPQAQPQAVQTTKGQNGPILPLMAALEALKPLPAPILRSWLSLSDAEEYSGLPESFLLHLIQDRKLAALDVGVRKGGRWRVSRRDLDAVQGVLVQRSLTLHAG